MNGRVVLVTGAARRVGAVVVRDLAKAGWRVALHYRGDETAAQTVAETVTAVGGVCRTFHADLAVPAERDALIPAVVAVFGRIDAVVNNASLFEHDTLDSLTDELWRAHIDANLTAPVFLIRDFARAAAKAGLQNAAVVNILDQKVLSPNPDHFSYTAGKVGLAGLTQTLALALAPGIRVMGVAPGLMLPSGGQTEADFERAWVDTPLGRGATPEQVASVVLMILETPSLTGQILAVDGGEFLNRRPRDVAFDAG